MPKTIYVSMLPYNWRRSFETFDAKLRQLATLCTPGAAVSGDARPLHIVIASEYMFRRNPMSVVKKPAKSRFMGEQSDVAKFPPPKSPSTDTNRYRHTIHSAQEKDQLLFTLCRATAGNNVLLIAGTIFWAETEPTITGGKVTQKGTVRNTAYAFHEGSIVCSYSKSEDVAELDREESPYYGFAVGTAEGGVFVADDLTFGLEICGDQGKLKYPGNGDQAMTRMDMHIVVSDGSGFSAAAIHKGGFGLHCDRGGACRVFEATTDGGGLRPVASSGERTWTLAFG